MQELQSNRPNATLLLQKQLQTPLPISQIGSGNWSISR